MKTNKKYFTRTGILTIFIILLCNYISAFGVGGMYHEDFPLEMSAGEIKEINFNLQNMPGPTDLLIGPANIVKGSEIIEFVNSDEIPLPIGGSIDLKAIVTIPFDAKIGDIYPIEITFNTITEGGTNLGFGSSVGRNFDVIVVPTAEEIARLEQQKPITQWVIYSAVIILAIILVTWLILRKKRRK